MYDDSPAQDITLLLSLESWLQHLCSVSVVWPLPFLFTYWQLTHFASKFFNSLPVLPTRGQGCVIGIDHLHSNKTYLSSQPFYISCIYANLKHIQIHRQIHLKICKLLKSKSFGEKMTRQEHCTHNSYSTANAKCVDDDLKISCSIAVDNSFIVSENKYTKLKFKRNIFWSRIIKQQ